jgi:thiamine biosynthesis lipoprotein
MGAWCVWVAGSSLIVGFGTPVAAAEELQKYEFLQIRMGVPVEFQVYATAETAANNAAEAAYARFKELDRVMSDYDPDSELMRLCRDSGPGRPVKVSDDLWLVLSRAQELAQQTDGAFDVTLGPLTDLWRKSRRRQRPPSAEELADARQRVGQESLRLDAEQQTVELLKENMRLDLGGIAIGYAADEALRVFQTHGLTRVLIDASGDIVAGDPPPGRDAWRIEMEPLNTGRHPSQPRQVLSLVNCAVTTSGDAYKFVEFDGVRYSHIVDPRTGLGLTRRSSATVIAADGITADSLATAVSVHGPERGLELVKATPHAALYFVQIVDDRERVTVSPHFADYVSQNPAHSSPLPR